MNAPDTFPFPILVQLAANSGMVCLVGSGGKTTLMYSLGRALLAQGRTVLCSTTTKIFSPTAEDCPLCGVFPDPADAPLPPAPFFLTLAGGWLAEKSSMAPPGGGPSAAAQKAAGTPSCSGRALSWRPTPGSGPSAPLIPGSVPCPYAHGRGKLLGYSPGSLQRFWAQKKADVLLIEADGAAGRPLKAPSAHEPVVPANAALVIAVIGLNGIGQPLDDHHVWRVKEFSTLCGLAPGSLITPEAVAQIACHPRGLFKGAPPGSRKVLFLNEAQHGPGLAAGKALAAYAFRLPQCPVDSIFIGSARQAEEALCVRPA